MIKLHHNESMIKVSISTVNTKGDTLPPTLSLTGVYDFDGKLKEIAVQRPTWTPAEAVAIAEAIGKLPKEVRTDYNK